MMKYRAKKRLLVLDLFREVGKNGVRAGGSVPAIR